MGFFSCLPRGLGRLARFFAATSLFCAAAESAGAEIRFEVQEQAGISRFSYPVHVKLELHEPAGPDAKFRLLAGGRPVVAQVRPAPTGRPHAVWWLDFNISLAAYESRRFTLQYGPGVSAGPERQRGHALTQREDVFEVTNAPYITWTIPRNLAGLLRSVSFPPNEHLRTDSPGLYWLDRQGTTHRLGGPGWQVTPQIVSQGKEGVALRFELASERSRRTGVVDLFFPVTKSWVEVEWQVADAENSVAALGADLNLKLTEPTRRAPTLVDFGASSLVYDTLRPGQQIELQAGMLTPPASELAWQVLRLRQNKTDPFVLGPRVTEATARPDGWAHLMDQQACLALAVHQFGRQGEDRIRLSAEGQVRVQRTFRGAHSGAKRLRFWLHFVHFPPHRSAATSPQSMQNPLIVRWLDG